MGVSSTSLQVLGSHRPLCTLTPHPGFPGGVWGRKRDVRGDSEQHRNEGSGFYRVSGTSQFLTAVLWPSGTFSSHRQWRTLGVGTEHWTLSQEAGSLAWELLWLVCPPGWTPSPAWPPAPHLPGLTLPTCNRQSRIRWFRSVVLHRFPAWATWEESSPAHVTICEPRDIGGNCWCRRSQPRQELSLCVCGRSHRWPK